MFKDKLKQLRVEKGLTQTDVALAIGVTPSTIGNYEQGTRLPRKATWDKLTDFFQVSSDYLLDDDNNPLIRKIADAKQPKREKDVFSYDIKPGTTVIYDNEDITPLLSAAYNESTESVQVTSKQRIAYVEFRQRSAHALYARRQLLDILSDINSMDIVKICQNCNNIVELITDDVVYWYKKCWNNIDDLFPIDPVKVSEEEIQALNTENSTSYDFSHIRHITEPLYTLLDRCLCVDMIATDEFYLVPLDLGSYYWLREKLHPVKKPSF